MDHLCYSVLFCYAFMYVCLLMPCHFPIGILGQVWYLIVSIPDLCTLTYFVVTCYERADLSAFVCDVCCDVVTFPLVSWVRCGA